MGYRLVAEAVQESNDPGCRESLEKMRALLTPQEIIDVESTGGERCE